LYDQHFCVDGKVERLRGDLIDTFNEDIVTFMQKHLRWAALEAAECLRTEQKKPGVRGRLVSRNPIEARRWLREQYHRLPLFLRPTLYFLYRYIILLGFLDGKEGLIFHFLQGFWFRFLVDVLIFERRMARHSP
jgi:hypothetical protein